MNLIDPKAATSFTVRPLGTKGKADSPASPTTIRSDRAENWHEGLIRNSRGTPKASLANVLTALRKAPQWGGVIGYDRFADRVTLLSPPPWAQASSPWVQRPWCDNDDRLTAEWMQRAEIDVTTSVVAEAVQCVAFELGFHPVVDYLKQLVWDGQARLDGLLPVYFDCERTRYIEQIGAKWMIAGVARVMRPGCKADHLLILEGHQGARKSQACGILAGEWFTDRLGDVGSKESLIQLQGMWIIEIGELDGMSRADQSRIKQFFSCSTDRFRSVYGRRAENVPRQCIFVGTTNFDAYLKDETGARRFWPAKVGAIDLEALSRDRDQLWAEAYARFQRGEEWWLTDSDVAADALQEQAARYVSDVWQEAVESYVAENTKLIDGRETIAISDIYKEALHIIEVSKLDPKTQSRVVGVLKHLGFDKKQVRVEGGRRWLYVRSK